MPLPADLEVSYSRTLNHADKLFESLDGLAAAGGLRRLASHLSPKGLARAAALLGSVRASIDEQLAGLTHPPKPARKTLLRRQANAGRFPTVR